MRLTELEEVLLDEKRPAAERADAAHEIGCLAPDASSGVVKALISLGDDDSVDDNLARAAGAAVATVAARDTSVDAGFLARNFSEAAFAGFNEGWSAAHKGAPRLYGPGAPR
jgi:hypothetical protein